MKKLILSVIMTLASLALLAAAIPTSINYQGVLRDSAGNLVTGKKAMTFKIYAGASGGAELWTMASPEVDVNNGLYNVKLGPLTSGVLGGSGSRWLEVTVGTDVLTPRLEILGVAYAIMAASAESAATAANASTVGGYSVGSTGNNIIPVTDGTGKLNAAVIPSSGLNVNHAASADYATLSGTATSASTATNANYATLAGTASNAASATNADTVDSLHAGTTATANQLLALDANKQFKGMSVSAEASGNNYALFINGGKLGAATGSNMIVGTGQINSGISNLTINNTSVTSSSLIFLTVGNTSNTNGGVRVGTITAGTSFVVQTMTGGAASDNIPFHYLIIN